MMRIFVLIFVLLVSSSLFAQVERGKYLIGGNVDISSTRQGTNSVFNMSLAPTFGVFVVKGFGVGARYSFGLNSSRSFNANRNEYVTTTIFTSGVGTVLRYYFGKKSLKGIVSANANYLTSVSMRRGSGVWGTHGFSATGFLGMAYFFNEHVGLESGMYVSGVAYEKRLPITRIGFSVGIFALLDKKKKQ